ncbi:ead/Ea22-like family protein [Escherichia coli]|nr:ead/Ea22-like family protein [Escherichia coli]
MSKIDYQELREAAEQAIPAMERLLMLPADDDLLSEQELKDYGVDIDALNAFKFLTGPETVLALLDERERNQQYIKRRDQENEDIALTVGKLRVELEAAKSKLNEQREYYEGVIADGSKRIAELESGSQAQKLVEAIIVAIENEQERLFDEDYLMDSKECIDVIREEVKRWNDSRAAGIRIKGEEHGNKTRR